MIQRRGGACFLLEATQAIGIRAELGGQDLDGNISPEPRVVCPINFTHPADPKQGQNCVRAEANTGL